MPTFSQVSGILLISFPQGALIFSEATTEVCGWPLSGRLPFTLPWVKAGIQQQSILHQRAWYNHRWKPLAQREGGFSEPMLQTLHRVSEATSTTLQMVRKPIRHGEAHWRGVMVTTANLAGSRTMEEMNLWAHL